MGGIQKHESRRKVVMKTEYYSAKTGIIFGDKLINVKATYHIENDGIGAYEYWGAKCFDRGTDYPEIDDIEPLWDKETDAEKDLVLDYINENFESLAEQITEEMMFDQDGYL